MRRRNVTLALAVVLAAGLLVLGGCSNAGTGSGVSTVTWESDGNGWIEFSTNDSQYHDTGFSVAYYSADEDPVVEASATAKKNSGSSQGGFGMVFCDQAGNNDSYEIHIWPNGAYEVIECISNVVTSVASGSIPTNLNTGLGVENVIRVTYTSGSPGYFEVYFNTAGSPTVTIDNGSGGTHTTNFSGGLTGGMTGFIVEVDAEANENFPNVPVDTRFKMSKPTSIL